MPQWKKDRRGKKVPYGRVKTAGREKTKKCKTWEEAQRWEIDQKDKARKLEQLIRTDCLTLHKLLSDYLTNVKPKVTVKTYNEKRLAVKRMLQDIPPETPVEQVSYGMVEDHLDRVHAEVSGHRANKSRKNIVRAYNWGIRRRIVPAPNPWMVEKYPEDEQPRYIPPEDDFWKVVYIAKGQEKRALLTCLYTAGRMNEVFGLRPADIDWSNERVRLWTRKRKGGGWDQDWIPMVNELALVLKEQIREHPFQDPLFRHPEYTLDHWTRYMLPRLCQEANVEPFGFHAIRHLSASMLDRAGVSVKVIQLILRHKNMATTDRYLHQLRGVQADLSHVWGQKETLQPDAIKPEG